MKLEDKIALWVDLGKNTKYSEIYELQKKLALIRRSESIPDIILQVQHQREVNFGSKEEYNLFDQDFLKGIGDVYNKEPGEKEILQTLQELDIHFSKTNRGGGATVVAPGQMIYYPIVDVEKVTGKPYNPLDMTSVGAYKKMLDNIMYDVLKSFEVPDIFIADGKNPHTGRDRRDVWYQEKGNPISYKIGSKGIKISKGIAYHGFVLYMYEQGIENFGIVRPCGYDHNVVSVTSVEKVKEIIPETEVHKKVKEIVHKKFGYEDIHDVSKNEFYNMLKVLEYSAH